MDETKNERMDETKNERTNERTDETKNERTNKRTKPWWTVAWMDRRKVAGKFKRQNTLRKKTQCGDLQDWKKSFWAIQVKCRKPIALYCQFLWPPRLLPSNSVLSFCYSVKTESGTFAWPQPVFLAGCDKSKSCKASFWSPTLGVVWTFFGPLFWLLPDRARLHECCGMVSQQRLSNSLWRYENTHRKGQTKPGLVEYIVENNCQVRRFETYAIYFAAPD